MPIDYRSILLKLQAQLTFLESVEAEDNFYFEMGNDLKQELDAELSDEDKADVAQIVKDTYEEDIEED